MRFWNRKSTLAGSDVVKPTTGYPTRESMPGSRRPFSPTIPGAEPEEKQAPVASMTFPTVDPTDTTPGGVDAKTPSPTPTGLSPYTITNLTIDRTYDANGSSVAELADVLGTLITDIDRVLSALNTRLRVGGL